MTVMSFLADLFFDVVVFFICRILGHATVFVCTLGQRQCEDNTADVIGAGVLIAIVVTLAIWFWR